MSLSKRFELIDVDIWRYKEDFDQATDHDEHIGPYAEDVRDLFGVGNGKVRAMIRYHESSGLVFVRGTSNQIALVQNVVRILENDLRVRRDLARVKAMRKLPRSSPRKTKK